MILGADASRGRGAPKSRSPEITHMFTWPGPAVSDLLFHRLSPDSLFSSAHDGSVCQWNVGTTAASGLGARLHAGRGEW